VKPKITFLNGRLQSIYAFHQLPYKILSQDSGNPEKSQSVLGKAVLRWHSTRYHHATLSNTATCAQESFGKPFSLSTVGLCIKKCHLNLCYARRKLSISSMWRCRRVLWAWAHLRWSRRKWKCLLWSDVSMFQLVLGRKWNSPKDKRDQPDFHQRRKANICPGIEVYQCKGYG